MGFTAQDCRHARCRLLFRVHEPPESESESSYEEEDFQGYTREEIFFQKVAIPRSFLKTTASILQVLVRVTPPSDPGLKTSKKRSRNPKRWKRNIRKPRQKESIIPRRWEKSNPQERKVLLAAALENVLNK